MSCECHIKLTLTVVFVSEFDSCAVAAPLRLLIIFSFFLSTNLHISACKTLIKNAKHAHIEALSFFPIVVKLYTHSYMRVSVVRPAKCGAARYTQRDRDIACMFSEAAKQATARSVVYLSGSSMHYAHNTQLTSICAIRLNIFIRTAYIQLKVLNTK